MRCITVFGTLNMLLPHLLHVFVLCRNDLRPSNVFIVELFELAGAHNPVDRVVGWGALPMCDPTFKAAHGRFRIPLIRGEAQHDSN